MRIESPDGVATQVQPVTFQVDSGIRRLHWYGASHFHSLIYLHPDRSVSVGRLEKTHDGDGKIMKSRDGDGSDSNKKKNQYPQA